MVRARKNTRSVAQKLLSFGAVVDAKKSILAKNVLRRVFELSDDPTQRSLAQTNRAAHQLFRQEYVPDAMYWFFPGGDSWRPDERKICFLKRGQILEYEGEDETLHGHYELQRLDKTSCSVKLRRLTTRYEYRRSFRKAVFKLSLALDSNNFLCLAPGPDGYFWDALCTDHWSIVSHDREGFRPVFELWCDARYPAWKLAEYGYPDMMTRKFKESKA